MLTHCPECQKELSTAATTCPHCGANVDHGKLTAAAAGAAAPAAQPKKSHFLRNCLLCGCFLVLLGGAAFVGLPVYMVSQLAKSVVSAADAPALANEVAPGVAAPTGFSYKGGFNFSMFGLKAKAVVINPTGAADGTPQTMIIFGGYSQKNLSKEQIHENISKVLQGMQGNVQVGNDPNQPNPNQTQIVSSTEEDLPIGAGTDTVKAQHLVSENTQTKARSAEYVIVLDPYQNEFGYLVIAGVGPEEKFDLDALKAFLKTVKK